MTIPPDYLLPENRPAEFYYSIHKAVIEEEHDLGIFFIDRLCIQSILKVL